MNWNLITVFALNTVDEIPKIGHPEKWKKYTVNSHFGNIFCFRSNKNRWIHFVTLSNYLIFRIINMKINQNHVEKCDRHIQIESRQKKQNV